MQSHLRPHVMWYVVMNILEEYSESVFTGDQKVDSLCPDQNLGIHQADYTVP